MVKKVCLSLSIAMLCALCLEVRSQVLPERPEFRSADHRYEFTSLLFKLRSMKQELIVMPGWPRQGEFFKLSEEMLRHGSAADFKRLAEDENPVVRAMGLICLAQAGPGKYAAVLSLHFGDKGVVSISHDCMRYETTVGDIAKRLLSEPDFLGHRGKQAGAP